MRTWMHVGYDTTCDVNGGEMFLESSRGEFASLEECKKSCEGVTGCQTITYFKNRWCSHFSTPCSNTKRHNKAASHRLSTGSRNNTGSISIASRYVPEHGIRMYTATMRKAKRHISHASAQTYTLAGVFASLLCVHEFI